MGLDDKRYIEDDVPQEVTSDFVLYETSDVTWPMFLCMTEAERQFFHTKLGSSHDVVTKLNLAAVRDPRRTTYRRQEYGNKIKIRMNKMGKPDSDDEAEELTSMPLLGSVTGSTWAGRVTYPDDSAPSGSSTKLPPLAKLAQNFVGIRNQSSTCYLNALLQALFHLPCFRSIIYKMPVADGTEPGQSIPLALQVLFFSLQQKRSLVKTVDLTTAFGWTSSESAIQHDIHELTRKLLDELEEHTKGTALADSIPRMFSGQLQYYTRCLDVEYTSRREEAFYDVELVVKGNDTLDASLASLVKPERFEGDNKYCWEHDDEPKDASGKYRKTYHTADRGVAYKTLPPVLMIHPNRLEFDMTTFQRVTVQSKWGFPLEIDFTPYLADPVTAMAPAATAPPPAAAAATTAPGAPSPSAAVDRSGASADADASMGEHSQSFSAMAGSRQQSSVYASAVDESNTYVLRSVVIHSGYASAGHYYCYVNFNGDWVRFNDESVTDVTYETMAAEAVGGETTHRDMYGYEYTRAATTRASLLIYVKKTMFSALVSDCDVESDVTPMLRDLYVKEVEADKAGGGSSYSTGADGGVDGLSGPFVPIDEKGEYLKHVRAPKQAPERHFSLTKPIGEQLGEEYATCALWAVDPWFNGSCRRLTYAATHHTHKDKGLTIWRYAGYPALLFVGPPGSARTFPTEAPAPGEVRDPEQQPLLLHVSKYTGSKIVYQGITQTIAEFKALYLRDKTAVILDSDKKLALVDPTNLMSGDMVIVVDEEDGSPEEAMKVHKFATNALEITVYSLDEPDNEPFVLTMLEETGYDEIQDMIYNLLGQPTAFTPRHIGIRNHSVTADLPARRMLLPTKQGGYPSYAQVPVTLKDLLNAGYYTVHKLHYDIIPITADVVQSERMCDFTVQSGPVQHHLYHKLVVPNYYLEMYHLTQLREATAAQFHAPVESIRCLTLNADGRLLLSSLHPADMGTHSTWRESDVVLEIMPKDVWDCPAGEEETTIIVDVQHCCRRSGEDYFSTPSVVRVRQADSPKDVLARIVAQLGFTEADAKGWRLLFRETDKTGPPHIFSDVTAPLWPTISPPSIRNRCFFMVEHPIMALKPSGVASASSKTAHALEPELRILRRPPAAPAA